MKIAVMGAGALGGYFGGRLAAVGHDVSLIARGAHLAALRENGLHIQSPRGDLHLPDISATDDPATVGPCDVVMFMVKNGDVETAAHAIKPMLGPDTMVVTCQNGVSAPDRLADIIGAGRVVPGVARIPAEVTAPGVIRHTAEIELLVFGEVDGRTSERCQRFADALTGAGCGAQIVADILVELWKKFVMQASLASLTALTRLNIGPLRDNPASADLFRRSAAETARVGRAVITGLPEGVEVEQWDFVMGVLPGNMHASMLDDLLRGKPIENAYLSGDVVRLGQKHGIPTPLHAVFAAALSPFEAGAPQ